MPAMMMGSAAVFIDCDDCWKLLLVTRRGLMYMWDLYNRTCILQDSLASLVPSPDESLAKDAGREADESRQREVCESFLGPPMGMVGSASSTDPQNPAWDPDILGMKKHKLLRLPSMAANQKVQRLLNEFMDLLSEYEAAETKADVMDVTPQTATEANDKIKADPMAVTPQIATEVDDRTKANPMDVTPQTVTEANDNVNTSQLPLACSSPVAGELLTPRSCQGRQRSAEDCRRRALHWRRSLLP